MYRFLVLVVACLALPAEAQSGWLFNPWSLRDTGNVLPATLETWTSETLVAGSHWLAGLGFEAPALARTGFEGDPDRRYVVAIDPPNSGQCGSELGSYTYVMLSLCTSMFQTADGRWIDPAAVGAEDARNASHLSTPVHELFHAVEESYLKPFAAYDDERAWVVEGMSVAVEYAWSQKTYGVYGLQGRPDYSHGLTDTTGTREYSIGHFWFNADRMLAGDSSPLGALRTVLEQTTGWEDGITAVDRGLAAAAMAFEAPRAYRGGLYHLFPWLLAEHADEHYFGDIATVEMTAPSMQSLSGTLLPLAADAVQIAIDVDEERMTMHGTPVRFTLEPVGWNPLSPSNLRAPLHLIVGDRVAGRPALDATPYTHVVQVFGDTTLLARVANVAEDPAATVEAAFELHVEVEGFYGEDVTEGAPPPGPAPLSSGRRGEEATSGGSDLDAGEVAGALPPGFRVRGPGPWACEGGSRARALFDLMTPDELGRDADRALPEMVRDVEDMMDGMEVTLRRMEQQGIQSGISREQFARLRAEADAELAAAQAEAEPDLAEAADDLRSGRMTQLMATFVGTDAGSECQMTLAASLSGREGGAQIIAGAVDEDLYPEDEVPSFTFVVYPERALDGMRALASAGVPAGGTIPTGAREMAEAFGGWEVCMMTAEEAAEERESARASDCPPVTCTAGRLVLERAEQGRIAGSFQFEVLRWPENQTGQCAVPTGRDVVTGHFNVASSDDGFDDNSLGGFGGTLGSGVAPVLPGVPILDLQDR